jgi:hypothetical protein
LSDMPPDAALPENQTTGQLKPASSNTPPSTSTRWWHRERIKALLLPAAAAIWAALGTFWSIFAWYHQEVVVPSGAPVNLVANVTVAEMKSGRVLSTGSKQLLTPVEVTVKASNVSTKSIYLLANYWDASAAQVLPSSPDADGTAWLDPVNAGQQRLLENGQPDYTLPGRFYVLVHRDRVGWGNLFPTTYVLHPKEEISASTMFYLPAGLYNMVHIEVQIATTEKPDLALQYHVDDDHVSARFFRKDASGTLHQLTDRTQIKRATDVIPVTQSFSDTPLEAMSVGDDSKVGVDSSGRQCSSQSIGKNCYSHSSHLVPMTRR